MSIGIARQSARYGPLVQLLVGFRHLVGPFYSPVRPAPAGHTLVRPSCTHLRGRPKNRGVANGAIPQLRLPPGGT